MITIGNPSEYTLIAKDGVVFNEKETLQLLRLPIEDEIPIGYQSIDNIFGESVYEEDGRLKPKFIGYARFIK